MISTFIFLGLFVGTVKVIAEEIRYKKFLRFRESVANDPEKLQAAHSLKEQYLEKFGPDYEKREGLTGFSRLMFDLLHFTSQSQRNIEKGIEGEEDSSRELENLAKAQGYKVLHDRGMKNSKANIDHILITDKGVIVVDSKNFEGKLTVKKTSKGDYLRVGGHLQSKIVSQVASYRDRVKLELEKVGFHVPVHAMLLFQGVDWDTTANDVNGVLINRRRLSKIIENLKVDSEMDIAQIAEQLAKIFPPR